MREEGLVKHRSSATMLTSLSRRPDGAVVHRQAAGVRRHRHLLAVGQRRRRPVPHDHGADGVPQRDHDREVRPGDPGGPAPAPAAAAPVAAAASSAAMSSADAATALASLADLRDRGAITAEEFEAKKADLLARM